MSVTSALPTILVLGATGDQGRPQVAAARAHGHPVRAAVRRADAAAAFGAGVETVHVDYRDPSTLSAAMQGVDVVLANYPSSSFNDGEWLIGAAEATGAAARAAGVGLMVFNTSLPQRDRLMGFRAHDVRFLMRSAFEAAGLPTITLAPVVFMGNLLRGWAFPHIAREGRFIYPHRPELEVSWICQEDLAKLALAAAVRPALAGRVIAVGGPAPLRGREVAATLSEASGRAIEFVSQSVPDFCTAMRTQLRAVEPEARERMIGELERIYRWYNESPDRPFRVDMGPVLQELPVTLTSLRVWAARQRWTQES